MNKKIMHIIAMFMIYIIMNISIAHAAITFNPTSDVKFDDRTAEFEWDTDDNSDSTVEYGADQSLGQSEKNTSVGSNHFVSISGLTPGTQYYYKISSQNTTDVVTDDNSGNLYSFTTLADVTPPSINVSLPGFHNSDWIGFTGVTDSDSLLRFYVNRAPSDVGTSNYDHIATADSTGLFIVPRLELDQDVNVLVI